MKERVPIREGLFRKDGGKITLLASRCPKCDITCFPKRDFCTKCLGTDMEEVELAHQGILYSFSILRVGDNHFDAPHPIGIIDLAEQRVRVTSPLVYRQAEDYAIGQKVEIVPDDLWEEEDKIVEGYRFRVIEEGEA